MKVNLSRQRLLSRVAQAIAGVSVLFLGLAVATSGVHMTPIRLDSSPVLGTVIALAGAAFAASQLLPLLRPKKKLPVRER